MKKKKKQQIVYEGIKYDVGSATCIAHMAPEANLKMPSLSNFFFIIHAKEAETANYRCIIILRFGQPCSLRKRIIMREMRKIVLRDASNCAT